MNTKLTPEDLREVAEHLEAVAARSGRTSSARMRVASIVADIERTLDRTARVSR